MEKIETRKGEFAPAITLMLMAPLLTEVLPGATRFSSIFVLPIEMTIWGGGALLIRYTLRRWQLGWLSMLLMAVGLAIAEEWLIQQTSLAPMVIHLKGLVYARAFGINYVYFLWALIYEPVFVVFLSVYLVELIYPSRKNDPWISRGGMFVVIPLFLLGSVFAWFTWTQIARVKVFHQPAFHPPMIQVIIAVIVIAVLTYIALGVLRAKQVSPISLKPLSPVVLGICGAVWATLLFGIVLLGFGISPQFPPVVAIAGGVLILALLPVVLLPKFVAHNSWGIWHKFALISGTIIGSMAAGQIGFIGTTGTDLYFKLITNLIAVILLIVLGFNIKNRAFAA